MFEVKNLCAEWKIKSGNEKKFSKVFSDVSFELPQNSLTALCGENGSGKSTLLSIMAGIPFSASLASEKSLRISGDVILNGEKLNHKSVKEKAKKISLLVQNESNVWDITARKLVENGRFVHQKWYENQTLEDEKIVDDAIKSLGLWELQNRPISKLSGGELQRFRIARSLAQKTDFIFLDEPLSGLDFYYQKELLELLKNLCRKGITVCLSIHDINLACVYADNLILMKKTRNGIFQGTPSQMMKKEILSEVFRGNLEIYSHPVTGAQQIW